MFHAKARSHSEILNDLYTPVVNYHACLRNDINRLIQTIESKALRYKLAQPEYNQAFPYDSAAEFYLYCCRSFYGGGTRWSTGERTKPRRLSLEGLRGESLRLQHVAITQNNALDIIAGCSDLDTLVYVDPPYLKEVRSSKDNRVKNQVTSQPRRQYAHELMHNDEHRELLTAIVKSNAMFIVSGYDSDLYDELLENWVAVRSKAQKLVGEAEEVLWISPNAWTKLPEARQRQYLLKPNQLSLTLDV